MEVIFTESELKRAAKNPDVLRAIANDHMVCSLEADSQDSKDAVKFHDAREAELIAVAVLLEAEI